MPLNFGAPSVDFSPLAHLGERYDRARKSQMEYDMTQARQKTLASLGDNPDMSVLGTTLLRAGDIEGGMAALRLAEATKSGAASRGLQERQFEEQRREHELSREDLRKEREAIERQRQYERERGDRPTYSPNALPDEFGDPHPGFIDPRTGTVTPLRTAPGPTSSIDTGGSPGLSGAVADAQTGGLTVTSAYRGPDNPLTRANPASAHAQGLAFDVRARTPEDADKAMATVRRQMASRGLQEGVDYKIQDEVRNPSSYATGPHVHVALTQEGSRKYGGVEQANLPAAGAQEAQQLAGPAAPGGYTIPATGQVVAAPEAPPAPTTQTQINKGTESIPPMTNAEMIQEARRLGITPRQYRDARAAAIQKELTSKSGAADPEKALGEQAGKLAVAEQYLANAPQIRKEIAAGGQTGILDRTLATNKIGKAGHVQNMIESGVDALVHMMTGAGMNENEARRKVGRYEPALTDTVDSLLAKHDQLTAELTHWRELAYRGKGTPGALPAAAPAYGAKTLKFDASGNPL